MDVAASEPLPPALRPGAIHSTGYSRPTLHTERLRAEAAHPPQSVSVSPGGIEPEGATRPCDRRHEIHGDPGGDGVATATATCASPATPRFSPAADISV